MSDYNNDIIVEYLAYFNQIDKHFDKILGQENFIPYNEKIKRIIEGKYPISYFVKTHKYELKFFGELRNHITHGIKLDGHNYAVPSKYAITKIKKITQSIKQPPLAIDVFKHKIYSCTVNDSLGPILHDMDKYNYSHIPVLENTTIVGILTYKKICKFLSNHISKNNYNFQTSKIGDLSYDHKYIIMGPDTNIFEIDNIFTIHKSKGTPIACILITDTGTHSGKILTIITSGDIAIVDEYVMH